MEGEDNESNLTKKLDSFVFLFCSSMKAINIERDIGRIATQQLEKETNMKMEEKRRRRRIDGVRVERRSLN